MRKILAALFAAALALPAIGVTGCDRDEKVLDVETQHSDVEVERDADTGALEVESHSK